MESDAKIRASDADRDRVAEALREHLAAGRLTIEEFNDRLGQAFTAKTLGDLQDVLADLPSTDLALFSEEAAQRPPGGPVDKEPDGLSPAWPPVLRPWLVISLVFFLLWLFSGAAGGPWFVYLALIAGAVLLLRHRRGPPPPHGRDQVRAHGDRQELDD